MNIKVGDLVSPRGEATYLLLHSRRAYPQQQDIIGIVRNVQIFDNHHTGEQEMLYSVEWLDIDIEIGYTWWLSGSDLVKKVDV